MTLVARKTLSRKKVVLDLDGPEGNAWSLLGMGKNAAQALEIDFEPIRKQMMAGNYRNLVETFDKHFGELFELILPSNWDEYEVVEATCT